MVATSHWVNLICYKRVWHFWVFGVVSLLVFDFYFPELLHQLPELGPDLGRSELATPRVQLDRLSLPHSSQAAVDLVF